MLCCCSSSLVCLELFQSFPVAGSGLRNRRNMEIGVTQVLAIAGESLLTNHSKCAPSSEVKIMRKSQGDFTQPQIWGGKSKRKRRACFHCCLYEWSHPISSTRVFFFQIVFTILEFVFTILDFVFPFSFPQMFSAVRCLQGERMHNFFRFPVFTWGEVSCVKAWWWILQLRNEHPQWNYFHRYELPAFTCSGTCWTVLRLNTLLFAIRSGGFWTQV